MFNFLKKLFKEKEETKEEISINKLEEWFNNKTSTLLNELNSKISIVKNKISNEVKKTKDNLDSLQNATLHNPNISLKEKQFMEGNRTAYIKRASIFLKQINLEGSHEALLQFCSNFDNMLDSFGKSTFRPYKILQEFFANESRDIAINIKNLDNLVKELKGIIKEANLDSIENLKKDITHSKSKVRQKGENEERLKQKEKEKNDLAKVIGSFKKEVENLENSEESKKLNELKADKEIILAKIREHNSKLIHSFSVIEKALKKYSRMILEDEKLLNSYIENPINALSQDNELKIIRILEGLEKNILNNQIDLVDKKREKTLEEIKRLNKEFFNDFLSKSKELESELEKIEGKIKENKIERKIDEAKDRLEQKEQEMGRVDGEIESLKDEISKVGIEDLKRRLEEEIKSVLKIEIKIS